MKQQVVRCTVEDGFFVGKMEKVYLDTTKIELCCYGCNFFVSPFDSLWIKRQHKLDTSGKPCWFAIPFDVLNEMEIHASGAFDENTPNALNRNVLASIRDFIYDTSLSNSVKTHYDSYNTILKKLTECHENIKKLLLLPEYIIWSHLMYDECLLSFLNQLFLYARSPVDIFYDLCRYEFVHRNNICSTKKNGLTRLEEHKILIKNLMHTAFQLFFRSKNTFQNLNTYKKLLSSLIVDMYDCFIPLCCCFFMFSLDSRFRDLIVTVIEYRPTLLLIFLQKLSLLFVDFNIQTTNDFSLETVMVQKINDAIKILTGLIGLCEIIATTHIKDTIMNDFLTVLSTLDLPNYGLEKERFFLEQKNFLFDETYFLKTNQLCESSLQDVLSFFLVQMEKVYRSCCTSVSTTWYLVLLQLRFRKLIVMCIFHLLCLPSRKYGEKKQPNPAHKIVDWLLNWSVQIQNSNILMEDMLQKDLQDNHLSDLYHVHIKTRQHSPLTTQLMEYLDKFFIKDMTINTTIESQDTLKNDLPQEIVEENAIATIRSLLEGAPQWDDETLIFWFYSCQMDIEKTVDTLLTTHETRDEIKNNGKGKRDKEEIAEKEANSLKQTTLNLAKHQTLEGIREAMREGKTVIVDGKIKHDLPSLEDILPDDGDKSYLNRQMYGFWDEKYKSTFVHDNDEPDSESVDLNGIGDYIKENTLATEGLQLNEDIKKETMANQDRAHHTFNSFKKSKFYKTQRRNRKDAKVAHQLSFNL